MNVHRLENNQHSPRPDTGLSIERKTDMKDTTHTLRTFFDGNKPLVIARDGEQLDLVTPRDDRKAGYIGWRVHWDGDQHSAPSDGDAPAVYYLVETCSQQYSKECGAPTYGTQVWRIMRGEVTHDAWFEWESDPAKAVKELCDVYTVYNVRIIGLGEDAIPPVDPDSLRVVESDNACCYLVY